MDIGKCVDIYYEFPDFYTVFIYSNSDEEDIFIDDNLVLFLQNDLPSFEIQQDQNDINTLRIQRKNKSKQTVCFLNIKDFSGVLFLMFSSLRLNKKEKFELQNLLQNTLEKDFVL